MDIVYVSGPEVEATIGIYDWERKVRQIVRLDLEMVPIVGPQRGWQLMKAEDGYAAQDWDAINVKPGKSARQSQGCRLW